MLLNAPIDQQLDEARASYAAARPLTAQAQEEAARHMPGGNTRTVLYHGPFPIRVRKGEGATVTDLDGHRYLNLLGEYTAGIFGHSHPAIRRAVHAALDEGVNLGAHNRYEADLARLVTKRFPAMERVRFTNSGTEANLMAIGTARAVTARDKVLVFKGGYHGAVLYFGGEGLPINAPFDYLTARYNDADSVTALVEAHRSDIACILAEPMLGSSGCIPADPAFLRHLRVEADRCGALLIFDEVMTSRFGPHGASDLYGVTPDLMTLGKWVGGGMSFGAFGGRASLMALYDPTRPGSVPHAGTFNNNVVSMSAGIAALTEAFPPAAAEALHAKGEALRERLNALFTRHGAAFQATGVGSLINIHATLSSIRNTDDLADSDERMKELLFLDLLERGFYVARRGFMALSTPLTDDDLDRFLAAVDAILTTRANAFRAPEPDPAS